MPYLARPAAIGKPCIARSCLAPGHAAPKRARQTQSIHPPSGFLQAQRFPDTSGCRRSEEHTSELQSLMCISYAVFCLKKKSHTNDRDVITLMMYDMNATQNLH